jgi:urease alpha subunit
VQAAFALVLTPTVASELRGAGDVKVVKVTLIFGGAAVGAAVFTGVGATVRAGVGVGAEVGAGDGVALAVGEGAIVVAAVGVLGANVGLAD